MGYRHGTPEERFWRHVDKNGPVSEKHQELGNCWLWIASCIPQGYGVFKANGKSVYAHRFILGEIPDEMESSHLCEVRNCVRPSHLIITTHQANVQYRFEMGGTISEEHKSKFLEGTKRAAIARTPEEKAEIYRKAWESRRANAVILRNRNASSNSSRTTNPTSKSCTNRISR